jgi:hypothetical protein
MQDEHGGSGSNQTVDRIIKESPLVQTYRSTKTTIEKNFRLCHITTAHANPDMSRTFEEVRKHHESKDPYRITPGRRSSYIIPDVIDKGRALMKSIAAGEENNEEKEDSLEDDYTRPEMEDVLVDL